MTCFSVSTLRRYGACVLQIPRTSEEVRDLVRSLVAMARCAARNAFSAMPVVADDGPVVSLTSYGRRVRLVHLAIESIGRGAVRPSRIILWLDPRVVQDPPRALVRLRRRGLELAATADLGPHKKYLPYAMSRPAHLVPMVTADDDTIYPRRWLQCLVAVHRRHPGAVVAHRVDRILVRDGVICSSVDWSRTPGPGDDPCNIAVGVGGVLYPARFLERLASLGDGWRGICDRQDDLWLHRAALRGGVPVLPVDMLRADSFLPVRGTGRRTALTVDNERGGGNDRAVALLYGADDLGKLRDHGALRADGMR